MKVGRLPLNAHAKDKLLRLVGERYNPENDVLTIMTDRCPLRQQNLDYALYLLTALFHESWVSDSHLFCLTHIVSLFCYPWILQIFPTLSSAASEMWNAHSSTHEDYLFTNLYDVTACKVVMIILCLCYLLVVYSYPSSGGWFRVGLLHPIACRNHVAHGDIWNNKNCFEPFCLLSWDRMLKQFWKHKLFICGYIYYITSLLCKNLQNIVKP